MSLAYLINKRKREVEIMKKGKKLIALLMVVSLLVASFTACSKKEEPAAEKETEQATENAEGDTATDETKKLGDATLKVWGSQEDQEMLGKMVENFKALYPEDNLDISLGVVSEADAKTEVLKDTSVAADVFAFASDQIAELQAAGALYRITLNKDAIIAANSEPSIQAATVGGELYAYPSSADTYFMYYDKSKYTEDEVKSLETMMEKDLGPNVINFSFDADNGWYLSSFFFAAGCQLFGADGTDPTTVTFNDANGVKVGNYLIDLANNKKFANHDDGLLLAAFQGGTLGATMSGTWNAENISKALGENYGVAKLPTINLDGKEVQLSGMANFKLYGVNSQTQYPEAAMALADYLTSKECQQMRFETRSYAPTNVELASNTEALSVNPAVAALSEQSQYATLQTSIPQSGNYWAPSEAFGAGIMNKEVTKENLQENLDAFVNNILATLE
ncbi:carbohydrate ABC transporter substrate-binding protein (CUT1 family) [Mobilisporobacter senegalensis]|uniref:Carbohydrate ABC transporter substrate-binding protein (CUT1 family) n=2 Tax=Mobilisporobacter senegalensis TaxID=1329262 RepID=A0A3N1XAB6_9FIRM|nr:carbohydrate ABC transporter substrate-binding protein (CUT1 family) [Mobilisporobacter senegalensis]